MPRQFVVVPQHAVLTAGRHATREEAAIFAAQQVEKDRTARVVLEVLTKVEVSAQPRVDIVHVDEVEPERG